MPKNTETKKKEKSPKNKTKKAFLQTQLPDIENILNKTTKNLTSVLEIHPIKGISKKNKILEAILEGKTSPIDDNTVIKNGKIILNRDNVDNFINELLSKTECDKNFQHGYDQQERFDELIKLPASSSNPEKNSLKKVLATLIDVPLSSLENTKKYGIPKQEDFVKIILCLEKYFKEKQNTLEANVTEETKVTEETIPNYYEKLVPETVQEKTTFPITTIDTVPVPFLETKEEVRKALEDEEVENAEQKTILSNFMFTNSISSEDIPDIENIPKTELEAEQEKIEQPLDPIQYNDFLLNKEIRESENLKNDESFQFLYPEINDPNFNIKIAKHKEFNETKYDGETYDIEEYANKLCNAEFELTPHQLFVKNFLSMQTPYNCLLLYHGLGTGKTCSSIGIAEEMRAYMQQVGITQPILVIASPNVQENYRLQLFDDRKLRLENGLWKLNTCIGEAMLKEINPTNIIGIPKDRIIHEINSIINKNYRFMGYGELANYIKRVLQLPEGGRFKQSEIKEIKIKKIRKYFDNRLIIIDEVHNIRISEENKEKSKTASLLMEIAKYANNIRLLMLSATPMYNSHKEIIWLTNLINTVDKNSTIRESDVFDKDGNFKEKKNTKNSEGGKELLIRKLTGYVSYVRGENPYTFPYRIFPDVFSPENSLESISGSYPSMQMNNREIDEPMENLPVFITPIGEYQTKGYDFLMKHMRNKSYNVVNKFGEERELPTFENMDSFGYTYLLKPLEALDIVFPNSELDKIVDVREENKEEETPDEFEDQKNEEIVNNYIGKKGLSNTMSFSFQKSPYPNVYDYEYKTSVLNNPLHGRIFHPDNIGKYSNKIAKICDCIRKSKGIVLIYSQYIEGSIIPLALALEEMGINRFSSESYANKPLFKTPPSESIDSITMESKSQYTGSSFSAARYIMITGNKAYSPNNTEDIKYATNPNNKNGEKIKVVIISKAGSEGLDFKCIRQIHILDPWYNMNRIEQIIGRGVRNFSHCMLEDFKDRNVEIYLHATLPRAGEEPADLYVYRYAEKKARLIGKVNRLLKEIAVDCILNIGQHNFTIDQLNTLANNSTMRIRVSSRPELLNFQIGDRDYSDICDYEKCIKNFKCLPHAEITDVINNTYNDDYAKMNYSSITKRIRDLFKKRIVYRRDQLIAEINIIKKYPEVQIDFVLSRFVDNKNEYVYDEYGRTGYIINKDYYYVFQPIEITDENASIFDRSVPIDYKRSVLELELDQSTKDNKTEDVLDEYEYIKNKYSEILADIESKLQNVESSKAIRLNKRVNKETDWFINFGYVHHLLLEKHQISNELLNKYIIYHYLDTTTLNDRLSILRYLYSGVYLETTSNEKIIYNYFNDKIVKVRGYNAIILAIDKEDTQVEGRKKFFIQDKDDKWIWSDSQPTDEMETKRQSAKIIYVNLQSLNNIFGFMQVLKNNVIFKILDKSAKTKIGANCGGESKKDVIKRINMVSDIKYNYNDNEGEENIKSNDIVKFGLCIILEVLFRYYEDIKKNGKRWFLNLEQDPYQ
jgi:hypothetical protein